ncbi:MAG: hypothetical protein L0214_10010 [candidate division NC10 bacterium]|nr:hypothetical protein [candidate division NC10 bacterium]
MMRRLGWKMVLVVGVWVGAGGLAEASCAGSQIQVAAPPIVVGAAISVAWRLEPACDVIETGLLWGADATALTRVGPPIYGQRAAYHQAIPVSASGRYWLAAYARDEAGGTVQSDPLPVQVAVPPPPFGPLPGPHGSHGAPPTYTGTDADFLRQAGNPHFASLRRLDFSSPSLITQEEPFGLFHPFAGINDRLVASTHSDDVRAGHAQPLTVGPVTLTPNAADIEQAIAHLTEQFVAFGHPRPGLYAVGCRLEVERGLVRGGVVCFPDVRVYRREFGGLIAQYGERFEEANTPFQHSIARLSSQTTATYFIPALAAGTRLVSAKLVMDIHLLGDPSQMRLSQKPPEFIFVVSLTPCGGTNFCRVLAGWDFTPEAAALAAQGGGELPLTFDPIPPAFDITTPAPFGGFFRISWGAYGGFLQVDYPWSHGFGFNGLTLTFEEACPQEPKLEVTVMPQDLRPVLPLDTRVPGYILERQTEATVTARITTCPPQGGSPPASVEVTFEVLPPSGSPGDGGHAHNSTRPTGTLRDLGTGEEVKRCTVTTFDADGMGSCTLPVPYRAPEVSGVERIRATAPGFPAATKEVTVEVHRLAPLLEAPAKYVRVGTPNNHAGTNDPCIPQTNPPTSQHFESFFGQPTLVKAIEEIAATMLQQTGILLRVNDISLPTGGLFDIKNNWRTPHLTHRVGRHADIGFKGIRDGVCTDYNIQRLREVITNKTENDPLTETDHFHAFIR